MSVTEIHEEKETLSVDVLLPGHEARVTTPLFRHSRQALEQREGGRCFVCGCTADKVGPLEAHHHPIERSFAEMIDWGPSSRMRRDFPLFDWAAFDAAGSDPYLFVDDMRVNGLLLCKAHHIGKDEGIHALPFPIWMAQRYGREGYKFSAAETLHYES